MRGRYLTLILAGFSVLQVACSDSEKEQAVKYCSENTEECASKYIQLAGGAAATGESQVAKTGATVTEGQVPSTEILPASITTEQIKEKAAEVAAALEKLDSDGDESVVTTTSTATGPNIQPASDMSSSYEASSVEIGVTRLFDDEEEGASRSPSFDSNGVNVSEPSAFVSEESGSAGAVSEAAR